MDNFFKRFERYGLNTVGSDFPFAPELATMVSVGSVNERLVLPDELRQQIRRDNALQLFAGLQD